MAGTTRSRFALLGLGGAAAAVAFWATPAQSQESGQQPGPDTEAVPLDYDTWAEPLDPFDNEAFGLLNVCFAPGTSLDSPFVRRMHEVLFEQGRLAVEPLLPDGPGIEQYQLGTRWSGGQGNPRELTWSFVPDGLNIPSGIGEPADVSELFSRMDALFAAQGGRATWVNRFQQCFDRWASISGTNYTRITVGGNDWDDGALWGTGGSAGLRGDVRICMKPIDGANNVLAFNGFPSAGDMVIDRAESWGSSPNNHRFLRNTVMHEHGHGLGFFHVCSNNSAILMEPFLSTSFDGPRHDDIRAAHRHYGDEQEADNTPATATDVGILPVGATNDICNLPPPNAGTHPTNTTACSIDANGEQDYFLFTLSADSTVSVTVSPVGFSYDDSPQGGGGACTTGNTTDSSAIADLSVDLVAADGTTVLGTAAANPVGASESLADVAVPAGSAYIRVYEANSPAQSQMYSLNITVAEAIVDCPGDADGDGDVDLDDLLLVLGNFGSVGAGDVDGDGDVDLDDLLLVLGAFGTIC